ncbi:MAG: hypothetical protein ABIG68_12085, partial [Acidobacteriota bacterium]
GFYVLTPDIPGLRHFQIDPATADHVSFWLAQFQSLDEARGIRRIGLAGVSFSGTMALMAAALPENRRAAAFVLAIGAYSDLPRCAEGWFAAGPETVGQGRYPTRYYGRWVMMLDALDLIEEEAGRAFLRRALTDLLLEKDHLDEPPQDFGETALRWYRLAAGRESVPDPELARQIIGHLVSRLGSRLSPDAAAASVECPVFLAHGLYDDLIPSSESARLGGKIRRARHYLLVSPFVTHTHPAAEEITFGAKVRAASEMFVFLYRLVSLAG